MSLLSGAVGAALGAAGNIAGTAMSYQQQKKLLEKQQAFEREKAQNYHQWEVSDLKAAGLNPILSAGGSPTLGSPSAPSAAAPDIGGPITAAMERALKKESIKNQKTLMESQGKQAVASAKQAEANAKKAETEEYVMKKQAEVEAPRLEQQKKYNKSKVGTALNYVGMGAKDLQPAMNVLGTGAALFGGARMLGTARSLKNAIEQRGLPTGRLIPINDNYHSAARHQEWINQPTYSRGQMRY